MIPWAHPSPQPKRHLDRFSRYCTTYSSVSPYFTMGSTSPSKLPFSWEDLDPPSNTWFLGPTRVLNANGISIGPAVFCRDHYYDRQTDRQSYSVRNNRPHLRTYLFHKSSPIDSLPVSGLIPRTGPFLLSISVLCF